MVTCLEAASIYYARGWAPIPIPIKSKRPVTKEWEQTKYETREQLAKDFASKGNIGILLGQPSGVVDVDLDCYEAVALAPRLLPETMRIFGRASRPRSHYIYQCDGVQTVKHHDGAVTMLELRSTGCQTIFPGSTHPSGEPVEWEVDKHHHHVEPDIITRCVAELAAACLLVRNGWSQDDAVLAVQGDKVLEAGAISHRVVGKRVAELLQIATTRTEPTKPQSTTPTDLAEAIRNYNRDHAREYPRGGSAMCPICGHKGCWGVFPDDPQRWACWSAAHPGVGVRGNGNYHGDVLDIDAHMSGMGRVQLLRRGGYLGPKPATPDPRQSPPPPDRHPTPDPVADRLKPLTQADMLAAWATASERVRVPTGIEPLDAVIGGGVGAGETMVVLGGTGVGKSEFVRQVVLNCGRAGTPVVHVDVELGPHRIIERSISQLAMVPASRVRQSKLASEVDKDAMAKASTTLTAMPVLSICPGGAPPLDQLEAAIVAAVESTTLPGKPSVVVMDSIQRLAEGIDGEPRTQVTRFMRWAVTLALRQGFALIMTSEQARAQKGFKQAVLQSGAESRAIEYTPDIVIGLVEPEQAPDFIDDTSPDSEWHRKVMVEVAKNRAGRAQMLRTPLVFSGPCWGFGIGEPVDTLQDKIIDALEEHGPMVVAKVVKVLGRPRGMVQSKLRAMAHSGSIGYVDGTRCYKALEPPMSR